MATFQGLFPQGHGSSKAVEIPMGVIDNFVRISSDILVSQYVTFFY
jgi:hypothetical protein